MTRLPQLLFGRGVHAPSHRILEQLPLELVGKRPASLPHSIWEELWHLERWQLYILARARGERPTRPKGPDEEWPPGRSPETSDEWRQLLEGFFLGLDEAAGMAADAEVMDRSVGGEWTVRGALETLSTHNSYHLGRIVALRQVLGAWPPDDRDE